MARSLISSACPSPPRGPHGSQPPALGQKHTTPATFFHVKPERDWDLNFVWRLEWEKAVGVVWTNQYSMSAAPVAGSRRGRRPRQPRALPCALNWWPTYPDRSTQRPKILGSVDGADHHRARAHTDAGRSLCGGLGLPGSWNDANAAYAHLNRTAASAPSPSFGPAVVYGVYTHRRCRLLSPLSGNRLRTAGQ